MEPEIKVSFYDSTRDKVINGLQLGLYFNIQISVIYSTSFFNIFIVINPYDLVENIEKLILLKNGQDNEMNFDHASGDFNIEKINEHENNYWKITSIPYYADLAGGELCIKNETLFDDLLNKLITLLQDIANNIPVDM